MKKGWRGGLGEGTPSGRSSLRQYSANIGVWIPGVLKDYNIQSLNDAGAGDMHWIRFFKLDVDYKAFDLVPRVAGVTRHDITKDELPKSDAILCRMVLNHLDVPRIDRALILLSVRHTKT